MADKKTLLGIAIGVGAALAVPFAAPIVTSIARPLLKQVIKRALLCASSIRERLAVSAEDLDDLVAEIRAEVEEELRRKGPRARETHDGPASEEDANGIERARSGAST